MRAFVLLIIALVLVGCQTGDGGFYDREAKEMAVNAVGPGPFNGVGELVSVGPARERRECPQASSPQAGPCLDVDVMTELPLRNTSGELDSLDRTVQTSFDFFVWLEKNDQGHWVVTHSTYRPQGVPDEPT
jgi:hypothetical protein